MVRASALGPHILYRRQVFHICVHALQPNWTPSPRWIVDVVAMLDCEDVRADWGRMVELSRRVGTSARLHTALAEIDRLAPQRVPRPFLDELNSTAEPWEWRELALLTRMPPFGAGDLARWHWYQFRRLRTSDPTWRSRPVAAGLADYASLKLRVRRAERRSVKG
jgi:hypothetical protein